MALLVTARLVTQEGADSAMLLAVQEGGAIYLQNSRAELRLCTLSRNHAGKVC